MDHDASPPLTPLVSRAGLLTRGVTDAEIRARVDGEHWSRLARGQYVQTTRLTGLAPEQHHALLVRAELAARISDDIVASHLSAATLFDLPVVGDRLQRIELIRTSGAGGRITGRCHVRAVDLPAADRVVRCGVPATGVARTLVDVARCHRRSTAVVLADAALHRGLVTPEEIAEVFARLGRARGGPAARRALRLVDGRSESPGESLLRLVLVDAGIDDVELQVAVHDEQGVFVGRCDGALIPYGIVLEFDGEAKYGRLLRPGQDLTDVVLAEKRREAALVELGWLVIRVVWRDLHDPARLVDRITRAVAARARTGVGVRGSQRAAQAVAVALPGW